MIHKTVIVLLTLAAAHLAILWAASYIEWPSTWSKRVSQDFEILHAGRAWYIDFAPDSPPDLVHNITLQAGKLSFYRRVVKENCSQPGKVTRYELMGYVLGYGIKRRSIGDQPRQFTSMLVIHAPILPMLIIVAVYPAIAFIRGPLGRWRRRRKGLCIHCGYNLTGNVSGRCPARRSDPAKAVALKSRRSESAKIVTLRWSLAAGATSARRQREQTKEFRTVIVFAVASRRRTRNINAFTAAVVFASAAARP